jgi:hypothetical protein
VEGEGIQIFRCELSVLNSKFHLGYWAGLLFACKMECEQKKQGPTRGNVFITTCVMPQANSSSAMCSVRSLLLLVCRPWIGSFLLFCSMYYGVLYSILSVDMFLL